MIYAFLNSILRYYLSFLEGIVENLKWEVPLNAPSSKPSAFHLISVECRKYVGIKTFINRTNFSLERLDFGI